jgi:hypothetical protein
VQFTSDATAMLRLFRRLCAAGRHVPPPSVVVDAAECKDLHAIEPNACPIHMLPEIAPGSAVAFAPY